MIQVSIVIAVSTSSFEYQAWETVIKHPDIGAEVDRHVGYVCKYTTGFGNSCNWVDKIEKEN